jgi:uncharacterized protein YbjT (DUF2867 family)
MAVHANQPRIVVTTPTGNVGSKVTRMLVQAGVRPVVLCRSRERLDSAISRDIDAVELDQTDTDSVVAATREVDAMLWIAPSGTAVDPVDGYRRLGEVAATAITENAIGHVVFQSSVGAEARHGLGEIDGLGAAEQLLDATGANVAHLRCGYFFSNLVGFAADLQQGTLPTNFPLDLGQAWVAPHDIAVVATGLLLSRAWHGPRVQPVHGPADLTFHDVARIITETTGHRVEAQPVNDDDLSSALAGLGMPDPAVRGLVDIARGFRAGFRPADPRTALTTTPTTLAEWVTAHRAQLLGP